MLVLLATESAGGNWETALPAAAAVELVHNFSLIHDDIQDNSPLRRGRETVWKKWGIPQAINAGDSMFALAHIALKRLVNKVPNDVALEAYKILPEACLALTQGQFLDLSYEKRLDLNSEDYWPMINGKTATLLAACTQLGSLVAGANLETVENYRQFGEYVGLAFQVFDDILGIWGDSEITGKSADSDLVAGKKSLPVLYALENVPGFSDRWNQGPIFGEEVPEIAAQLEGEGVLDYAKDIADRLTKKAISKLENSSSKSDARDSLQDMAEKLIKRQA
jgi:geranylgeranyl diphosphate synthase type I